MKCMNKKTREYLLAVLYVLEHSKVHEEGDVEKLHDSVTMAYYTLIAGLYASGLSKKQLHEHCDTLSAEDVRKTISEALSVHNNTLHE